MRVEIDQSGKIEQTNLDTVVALSNDIQFSVVLEKNSKRALQRIFRSQGKSKMFIYTTFAAIVSILLRDARIKSKVIVDTEYPGHQDLLTVLINKQIRKMKIPYQPTLEFGFIGKSSRSHEYAAKVSHKKAEASQVISLSEIIEVIWQNKKMTGSRALSGSRAT